MGFWTVNFGVNFGVGFLREFSHGFLDRGFWCDSGVNFLRDFLSRDPSPVNSTVDSLFKVQTWPVLVTVDFAVNFIVDL